MLAIISRYTYMYGLFSSVFLNVTVANVFDTLFPYHHSKSLTRTITKIKLSKQEYWIRDLSPPVIDLRHWPKHRISSDETGSNRQLTGYRLDVKLQLWFIGRMLADSILLLCCSVCVGADLNK